MEHNGPKKKIKKIGGKGKNSVFSMRREVLDNNGVFLDWKNHIEQNAKNLSKQTLHEFNLVNEKGVFVHEGGCITPHPYYSKKGKDGPARTKGYKAAFNLFKESFVAEKEGETNGDGWPVKKEISHLCHWSSCMNPDHLVLEERWKNWKRLYCRGCDCNVLPECIGKFHPSAWWSEPGNQPRKLGYDQIAKLKEHLPALVTVLPRTHFQKDDQKARNRTLRKKRGKKHSQQAQRKKKLNEKLTK